MTKTATLLCAWGCAALSLALTDAVSSVHSPSLFTTHQANVSGALLTLSTADADRVWIQYEELVMSRTRRNPLILYFDGGIGAHCDITTDTNSDEDDDDDELVQEPSDGDAAAATEKANECRTALVLQNEQLLRAIETIAIENEALGLQIVRVPDELMKQMLRYVRVHSYYCMLYASEAALVCVH